MAEMNTKIRDAAKKAIEDIRDGVTLDDDLIAKLHIASAMDYLRAECKKEDLQILIKLAKGEREPIHKLAVGILKLDLKKDPYELRKEKLDLFIELWESKPEPPKIRINLMWRLLDFEDLPMEWHNKIYEFIKDNNWEAFIETQIGYMGQGRSDKGIGDFNLVLPNIKKRLEDKNFPSSKHWAYLASALAYNDCKGIMELLDDYKEKLDKGSHTLSRDMKKFTADIIEDMKVRCRAIQQ